ERAADRHRPVAAAGGRLGRRAAAVLPRPAAHPPARHPADGRRLPAGQAVVRADPGRAARGRRRHAQDADRDGARLLLPRGRAPDELGVEWLSSIELGAHLRALTGVKLANSVIFQYPTVNLLARHVLEQVTPQDAELTGPIVAEVEMLLDRLAAIHENREIPADLVRRLESAVGRIGTVSGAVS